jgi:hypothetical protein
MTAPVAALRSSPFVLSRVVVDRTAEVGKVGVGHRVEAYLLCVGCGDVRGR